MSIVMEKLPEAEYGLEQHEFDRVFDLAYAYLRRYGDSGVDTRSGHDLGKHSVRTMELVASFSGDRVPPIAGVAALLHDVIDRSINEYSSKYDTENGRTQTATKVMEEFFEGAQLPEHIEKYLRVVLHGLVRTEIASGLHRSGVATRSAISSREILPEDVEHISEIISGKYRGELTPETWSVAQPYLDFKHIGEFIDTIDIDSIFIKGCELADNLLNPASERESAKLQDVLEAESFYAPILELLKFDGLASLLRSRAHIVRLEMRGETAALSEAKKRLDDIENIGADRVIESVFGDEYCRVEPVVSPIGSLMDKPPIFIGDMHMDIDGDDGQEHGHYRVKSAGSLANKIVTKKDMPMDIMGMTIVSEDIASSARTFASFISRRIDAENSSLKEKQSPGKQKAIYVKGDSEYLTQVKAALVDAGIDLTRCQFKVHSLEERERRGYPELSVSKVTFEADIDGVVVPTEVQFVTDDERSRMRNGEIMHLVYKYINQENSLRETRGKPLLTPEEEGEIAREAVEALGSLKKRSDEMSSRSYAVNPEAERRWRENRLI